MSKTIPDKVTEAADDVKQDVEKKAKNVKQDVETKAKDVEKKADKELNVLVKEDGGSWAYDFADDKPTRPTRTFVTVCPRQGACKRAAPLLPSTASSAVHSLTHSRVPPPYP